MRTISERFWSKVDKNGCGGCWIWKACKDTGGYGIFVIGKRGEQKQYRAHRFAYTEEIGPIEEDKQLDHICHNRECVNPKHLRIASASDNARNCGIRRNNKSGYKGVTLRAGSLRWVATICVNKKKIHLGCYTTAEEAYAAYCEASLRLHGQFSNFGVAQSFFREQP